MAARRRDYFRDYFIDDPGDRYLAAEALAGGAVVAHAFGNFYALTARPDFETVRMVNLMKGRPPAQVGSVLTTRGHIDGLFDLAGIAPELEWPRMRGLIDDLLARGPFGFRGAAPPAIPDHLSSVDGGHRTVQLISPGYRCLSNAFIDEAMAMIGSNHLYVTSANRSRHATGAGDEPAHFEADELAACFSDTPLIILRHRDEALARAAYPGFRPMSTTVLGLHRLAGFTEDGLPRLIAERHGSLDLGDLEPILARHRFGLACGPGAIRRLSERAGHSGLATAAE